MLEYGIAIFVTIIITTIVIYSTIIIYWKVKVLVTQSCPTFHDFMDYSPPGSHMHGILQAGILEWIAIPFSWGSSWPRDQTCVSCIAGRFFTVWATGKPIIS